MPAKYYGEKTNGAQIFFYKNGLATRAKLISIFRLKSPMGILRFARRSLDTREKSVEVVALHYITGGFKRVPEKRKKT